MKNLIYIGFIFILIFGCTTSKNSSGNNFSKETKLSANDTVKIVNDELEYEVIIIDPGFNSWFQSYAKPRNFYSQEYLEARNRVWVIEWNVRATQGNPLYEMSIDYRNDIDYGYEVNYMLFNYLTYFQISNKIKLGGFSARI